MRIRPLVFWLCVSTFTLPFLHRFLMVFGARGEPRLKGSAGEAGTPCYCLIRLIQKVHYTTVLAPLRGFSLQPKGFFWRTRGRIYRLPPLPPTPPGFDATTMNTHVLCLFASLSFFFCRLSLSSFFFSFSFSLCQAAYQEHRIT